MKLANNELKEFDSNLVLERCLSHYPNIVVLKKTDCLISGTEVGNLSSLSTDPPGQLDVLGHDGNPFGMDSAEVGVLEEPNKICFTSLLKSHNSGALEAQISLEVLSNLTNQPLERQLADQQLS